MLDIEQEFKKISEQNMTLHKTIERGLKDARKKEKSLIADKIHKLCHWLTVRLLKLATTFSF